MGWERKRGKLHELNLLLRGVRNASHLSGFNLVPEGIQYVMTLDEDTRLGYGAVTKLVGKMHHPVNQPVLDPGTTRVVHGYGVMQPRVMPSSSSSREASVFCRVESSVHLLHGYYTTLPNVCQILLGESFFGGKGLYHVDAFQTSLDGRFQENTILSHDHLEGSFARSALVTDVKIFEDFPARYDIKASVRHRWARGDWQLLPYIVDSTSGVSALGRWKIIDSMFRTLYPTSWVYASMLGWYLMGRLTAMIWQAMLILLLPLGPAAELVISFLPQPDNRAPSMVLGDLWLKINLTCVRIVLRIAFMADYGCVLADGPARSLYRRFVSHRLLLEWLTNASAGSRKHDSPYDYYTAMWPAPTIAIVSAVLAVIPGGNTLLVCIPVAGLWFFSPLIARFAGQSPRTTTDRLTRRDAPDGLEGQL